MLKMLFYISTLLININLYAQQASCDEYIDFIKKEGFYKTSLSSYILNSSWLYKVTAYTYEFKTYVIAEIKSSQYSYKTNTYIFCGIPNQNWSNFQFGIYGDSESYGERFHKYIIDYKCNCN